MRDWYRMVMDGDHNPLSALPRAQRFQIMVFLSLMWTSVFCAMAGAWVFYGELLILHLLLASGVLITGMTFRSARQLTSYRDQHRQDGTARYDDVWGAN